jgi:O-antigen/teichoic acid export membrane protein
MDSTEESTSYKINTFLNLVLKIGSLGFNLLSIPLLISYLGEERFGIWQTLL